MKEKIIALMRIKGPVLPLDVSRSLNTNSIMAGAYLSELSSSKSIKISNLKIGGSPLYYLQEHEDKLQNYTHVLKGPEKKAYDLLKEKKILKDNTLDPVTRVSLQNIKDFAKPIEITINDQKEKYWKWYLTSNEELQQILKNQYTNNETKTSDDNEQKGQEEKIEPQKVEEKTEENITKNAENEQKPEEKIEEKKDIEGTLKGHEGQQEIEDKKEVQQKIEETKTSENNEQKEQEKTEQPKEEIKETKPKPNDEFYDKIINLFNEKNIEILHKEIIKSNSEIEFKILIPTPIGKILYYVVAKSKKRCSDADLSQAYVKAEMNKLPVLFIHSGDLTKKAVSMLKNEFKIITTYNLN
ncbi:MAG: hypothetical protein ACMXX8_03970 [Candidatus Woesearchaeota archaeon]